METVPFHKISALGNQVKLRYFLQWALCIVLSRLAYPRRCVHKVTLFGRSVPQLSIIFNQTIDLIDSSQYRTKVGYAHVV